MRLWAFAALRETICCWLNCIRRRNLLGLKYLHIPGTFLLHDIDALQGILYLAHGRVVLAHFKKYFQGTQSRSSARINYALGKYYLWKKKLRQSDFLYGSRAG